MQGQHKPFQIALSLNNAAVWSRERGGGKNYWAGCERLCSECRQRELQAERAQAEVVEIRGEIMCTIRREKQTKHNRADS